ncbi:MAG TPA: EAL domain-containing protein [Candidatus Saccharimonadia bacterium]|nr:EAL domain-containing protein [Candidatus Saccharimonadia bacterium]
MLDRSRFAPVAASIARIAARASVLLALLLACALPPASATVRDYYFQRVSAAEDLAQNTVNAILQDRTGFIWIATQGGLHRYDGYRFVLFQHSPDDPLSLPDSFVTALAEDDRGRLWIGTNAAGLAWYDTVGGRFVRDAGNGAQGSAQRRGTVSALLFDPAHGLFVASRAGLELVVPDAEPRNILTFDTANAGGSIRKLARAPDGTIWAATTAGLYRIDARTLRAEPADGAPPGDVLTVHVDLGGRLYAGTPEGLFRIVGGSPAQKIWPRDTGEARPQVLAIEEDAAGRLWLAVFPNGLAIVQPDSGVAQRLRHDTRMPGSLPEDSIRVLQRDRSGLLWLGGVVHGVAHVDPRGAKFGYLLDDTPSRPFVDTNNIRSLLEDAQGRWWIGTEGDGLKRYDPVAGTFEYFGDVLGRALGLEGQPGELRIFALHDAGAERLWVASNQGVFLLDPGARRATMLPVDPERVDGLPEKVVRSLEVGADGAVWLGTMTSGLVRHDPAAGSWARYRAVPGDEASMWHDGVLALHEDRAGRLWIGTFEGVNVLDLASGAMRRIPRSSGDPGSVAGDLIRVVHESADGSLWIGSHNGLSRLESLGEGGIRFRRYLARDGLPNSTVYGIVEDAAGDLWISTNRGIARLDRKRDAFTTFALEDGLQGLEFNGGSYFALRDGRIGFGGSQGVNVFAPERIATSTYQPRVALTRYQIGGERRDIGDPLSFARLSIPERERIVGFEFASLDFGAPRRNRFEYRLEGLTEGWIDNGTRNSVTFTNLDPGGYRLEVRGTNRDGVLSPNVLALDLTIAPLWWTSWPARIVYALLALAAIAVPIRGNRRKLARRRQHTRELREREERLKVAIWGSGDEFWDWDIKRGVIFRVGADQLLGFSTEQQLSGDDWRRNAVHPDDLERVEQILAEHVAGKREFFESEHRIRNVENQWVWVLSRGKIVERDADGQPLRIAGTARDITRTREAERERRIAAEVIRSMSEAVTVTDLEFRFKSINPAFTRMTGYSEDEIRGVDSTILNCSQHSEEFHRNLRQTLGRTGHWSGEIWQRRKDGEEFLCWLELSEVTDRNGLRTHWVGVLTDITDRKRAEQELRYLANYDTLTGLPNRTLLGERLAHALIRARRHGAKVAVLFLDLDRFKHVNDSMGHAAGDRLLKAAAARIMSAVRETDTVARLGGDEFTVVVEDLSDPNQAERVAQKLIHSFMKPLDIDGRTEVVISPSIGIAIYPDHGQVPTDLLKYADTAMYQAKDRGRNTYQLYTEAMDAQARLRASMVAQLHKAIERNEFHLVYQPKMALSDGRITGVEALLRWKNPELGAISPVVFIPIAEETGLIIQIGEWVIREACVQMQRWARSGLTAPRVAVNVSMLQLTRGEFYQRLKEILEDFRIPGHRIELELTESMVMANAQQSIATLSQIKSLGVHVAIDDFGTGYSSLAYLKRLPIDTLKIDKEFVGDITTDPDDEAITSTIIMMAHSLGLDVVAEGVETAEQLDYLREQKCDEVQGNVVSPPLDPERCLKYLLDHRPSTPRRGDDVVLEFPGSKAK